MSAIAGMPRPLSDSAFAAALPGIRARVRLSPGPPGSGVVVQARDLRRRRAIRRLISVVLPLDHAADTADTTPSIETATADRQELRQVTAAIAELPGNLRETLVLRTIEGLSQAETAETLGISEKAVETRLYRARQRLSASLS